MEKSISVKERTANSTCLGKQNETRIEKNWVLFPTVDKNGVKAIYNWSPKMVIGDICDGQFVETHEIDVPHFFKYLRGSTNGIIIRERNMVYLS
jgi:hypothetical protein